MANIGILKEFEEGETRVALNDYAISSLKRNGHKVFVSSNAGLKSGIENKKYEMAGAIILPTNEAVINSSDILMKVGCPSDEEILYFQQGQVLFSFLNLINKPEKALKIAKSGITAIGYETIFDEGRYPVLEPMSKLVGKACFSIGAGLLSLPNKGKGVFLGGSAGASRSKIVIFGGGNAGKELMKISNSSGSRVTVFDKSLSVINSINDYNPQIQTMYPHHDLIIKEIKNADLIVGATFNGKNTVSKLLTDEMIKMMEPKSVFIDLTTDLGGISTTTEIEEEKKQQLYQKYNIVHHCSNNIAATFPQTATSALSAPVLFYLIRYLITSYNNIYDDVMEDAIQIKDGKLASFIKKVEKDNDNEYNKKINDIIKDDEDEFDLNKLIKEDDNSDSEIVDYLEISKKSFEEQKEDKEDKEDSNNIEKEDIFSNLDIKSFIRK